MDYVQQIAEINSKLRDRAHGLKGSDLALKSGVRPSNISSWMRGHNCGISQLSKIAEALGNKIIVELKQNWESED